MTTEHQAEIANPDPLTQAQQRAFQAKLDELLRIEAEGRTQKILSYFNIGNALIDVYQDSQRGSTTYGANAIQRFSLELGMEESMLYRSQEFATRFTADQVASICAMPRVTWSHVREAVRLPTSEQRMLALEGLASLPPTQQSVRALRERIQAQLGPAEERRAAAAADREAAPTPKAGGGGGRTGTGRGASPMTPVKQVFRHAENLSGALANLIIALKEFDPDSKMVADKMANEMEKSAGVMVECLAQLAGSMEVVDEFLADQTSDENKSARRSMLTQAANAIQAYLRGEKDATPDEAKSAKPGKPAKTVRAASPRVVSVSPVSADEARAIAADRRAAALRRVGAARPRDEARAEE